MRKKENEITDPVAMESIIQRSMVCRLAMSEDNRPLCSYAGTFMK